MVSADFCKITLSYQFARLKLSLMLQTSYGKLTYLP